MLLRLAPGAPAPPSGIAWLGSARPALRRHARFARAPFSPALPSRSRLALGICAACCASTRTARCASPPASRSRPEAEACNLLPLRMLCAELPLTWMPLPSRIALLLPIAPSRCTCGVPSRLVPKVELRMPEPGGRQPVASLKDALLLLPASAVRPSALVLEGASPEPGPISAAFCATRVQPAPAVPASSEAASPSRTSWGRSAGRLSLFEARGGLAGLADTQKGESRAPPSCAVPGSACGGSARGGREPELSASPCGAGEG